MKKYKINPRRIKSSRLKKLHDNLENIGDLSGVVHDESTNEIITGNQRSKVMDINECEIVLEKEFSKPDSQGTTAIGHILWNDKKYFYRRVKWTEEQRMKACVLGNTNAGEWNFTDLGDSYSSKNLLEWNVSTDFIPEMTENENKNILDSKEKSNNEHIKTIQLFFNSKTLKEFHTRENKARNKYKTSNISDTIMNCIKDVYLKLSNK